MIRPCSVKISDMPSQVLQYNKKCRLEESETNILSEISVVFEKISSKEKFENSSPLHSDNSETLVINLEESEGETEVSINDRNGPALVYGNEETPFSEGDVEIESFVLFKDLQNATERNNEEYVDKEDKSDEGCVEITCTNLEEVPRDNVAIFETEEAPLIVSFQEEFQDLPDSSTDILQEREKLDQSICCSSCQISFQTVHEKYKHLRKVHLPKFKYGRRRFTSNLERRINLEKKHKKSKPPDPSTRVKISKRKKGPVVTLLQCIFSKNCNSSFKSNAEMEKHLAETHKNEKMFLCDTCDYKTDIKLQMLAHIQKLHGFTNLQCRLCPQILTTKYERKLHFQMCHYTSKTCNYCAKKMQQLQSHMRVMICKFCSKNFPCVGRLQKHKLTCSKNTKSQKSNSDRDGLAPNETPDIPKRRGRPPKAPKAHFQHKNLTNHRGATRNSRPKKNRCDRVACLYCSTEIDRRSFRRHMRNLHPELNFSCDFEKCIHYFKSKSLMQHHFKVFHPEYEKLKFLHCHSCRYKTHRAEIMKSHISRRHGSENLKCLMCEMVFKSQLERQLHYEKAHKNIKTCMLCKNPVRKIGSHLKTEKCKDCNQVFTCEGLFKIHQDQFHEKLNVLGPSHRPEQEVALSVSVASHQKLFCNLFVEGLDEEGMDDLQTLKSLTEKHLEKNYPPSKWVYVFTVGSPDGCGFGLHCLFFEEAAPTFPGVLQAQVAAIARAAEKVAEKGVFPLSSTSNFVVLSDSRQAIHMATISVSLKKSLAVLQGQGKELQVQWIPSGCKFIGKDRAQFLARMVSTGPYS